MLKKMTRAGYESPSYAMTEKEGEFEFREYTETIVVVSTTQRQGDGNMDGNFNRLFKYISGQNEREEKIAMTVPVYVQGDEEQQTMSFVVPKDVVENNTPAPLADDVVIEEMKPGRYIVYRFSGSSDLSNRNRAEAKLRAWLEEQQIAYRDSPLFAFYDPPWTPGPFKRNEVMFPLE